MNMKYRSFALALMAMVMAGCQSLERDSLISEESQFSATMESFGSQTKTSMSAEKTVLWSSGDRLAIFHGATIADEYLVVESSVGKTNATFNLVNDNSNVNGSFSAGTELLCNVALYPYAENLSLSGALLENEGVIYTINGATIPATQTYTENSFANGSFPMVAVTQNISDHTLKFKNVLGAMKLQLKGTQTVNSIKITGRNNEKLSGAATITAYSKNLTPAITMTGEGDAVKSVTLDCGSGVELDESTATDFIIALPPELFTQGFTVTVTDDQEQTYTITASTPNTILRSSILVMPVVNLSTMEDEESGDDTYIEYLSLNKTSLTMMPNTSYTLVADIDPVEVTYPTLTWSSSNSTVAEVDQNGKVTAKSDGTVTITALAVGGVNATCSIKVKTPTGVATVDYVDEYGVNHGRGIVVGDVVWAPVNCGYKAANGEDKGYIYGKLYQWGRKYGQGYDENDATYPSGENLVQGPVPPSYGSSEEHKDEFFMNSSSPYDWSKKQIDNLWSSTKTASDPCPKGWRVPTYQELETLSSNRSSWTSENSQNGYYFVGEYTYINGLTQLFLPAAGFRYCGGDAFNRGYNGYYWSSRPYGDYGAPYLSFSSSSAGMYYYYRANGYSVRCVQE